MYNTVVTDMTSIIFCYGFGVFIYKQYSISESPLLLFLHTELALCYFVMLRRTLFAQGLQYVQPVISTAITIRLQCNACSKLHLL